MKKLVLVSASLLLTTQAILASSISATVSDAASAVTITSVSSAVSAATTTETSVIPSTVITTSTVTSSASSTAATASRISSVFPKLKTFAKDKTLVINDSLRNFFIRQFSLNSDGTTTRDSYVFCDRLKAHKGKTFLIAATVVVVPTLTYLAVRAFRSSRRKSHHTKQSA